MFRPAGIGCYLLLPQVVLTDTKCPDTRAKHYVYYHLLYCIRFKMCITDAFENWKNMHWNVANFFIM